MDTFIQMSNMSILPHLRLKGKESSRHTHLSLYKLQKTSGHLARSQSSLLKLYLLFKTKFYLHSPQFKAAIINVLWFGKKKNTLRLPTTYITHYLHYVSSGKEALFIFLNVVPARTEGRFHRLKWYKNKYVRKIFIKEK